MVIYENDLDIEEFSKINLQTKLALLEKVIFWLESTERNSINILLLRHQLIDNFN